MDHAGEGRWYILNTLTQFEKRVSEALQRQINLDDPAVPIFEVQYPLEKTVEKRNGKTRTVERKFFPGYVFVRMKLYVNENEDNLQGNRELNENVWNFLQGIRGISRIGGEMSDEEVALWISKPGAEEATPLPAARPQFNVGDQVEIVDGPFTGFKAVVMAIDVERGFLQVEIQVFQRPTPVELEFWQVEKFVE